MFICSKVKTVSYWLVIKYFKIKFGPYFIENGRYCLAKKKKKNGRYFKLLILVSVPLQENTASKYTIFLDL